MGKTGFGGVLGAFRCPPPLDGSGGSKSPTSAKDQTLPCSAAGPSMGALLLPPGGGAGSQAATAEGWQKRHTQVALISLCSAINCKTLNPATLLPRCAGQGL